VTNRVHVLTFLIVLALASLAQAQTFTTLYNFTGGLDGSEPFAGVIQDPAGNLYGTTVFGGGDDFGLVYEVNTAGTETVLYSFTGYDGLYPLAPVNRDKAGNIYGTTFSGGSSLDGAVFKINTVGNETVLNSFTYGSGGCEPSQGLVRDNAGNLYGTTLACGSSDYGTIFKVDRAGNFTLLHSFTDGGGPEYGHLTMDRSGNLYGVTLYGGAYGVLYKLSKSGTLTVLHSFSGGTSDGCYPSGSVVQDKAGNFYGTTYQCGSSNDGTIWKVSKKGKETILHNFAGGTSDGCNPYAGVARDSGGNLYGVAYGCGTYSYGTLFELSASGRLTLLHSFDSTDGAYPIGEVLRGARGRLFGTTYEGGSGGYGTVWSYAPSKQIVAGPGPESMRRAAN
jgi:uncharacterized repeat protein (TIGR03803 family)